MVAADLTDSKLLRPFIVLNGKYGATLHKEYLFWDGTCEVAFQKKHWFDTPITIRWLKWLKEQYPPKTKIGLIWDHAPAHDSGEVEAYLEANEHWLTVMLIPGGMTSIMQVCDVVTNPQLKSLIRKWYMQWRKKEVAMMKSANRQVKLKLHRDDFIRGTCIEQIFQNSINLRNLIAALRKVSIAWAKTSSTLSSQRQHLSSTWTR